MKFEPFNLMASEAEQAKLAAESESNDRAETRSKHEAPSCNVISGKLGLEEMPRSIVCEASSESSLQLVENSLEKDGNKTSSESSDTGSSNSSAVSSAYYEQTEWQYATSEFRPAIEYPIYLPSGKGIFMNWSIDIEIHLQGRWCIVETALKVLEDLHKINIDNPSTRLQAKKDFENIFANSFQITEIFAPPHKKIVNLDKYPVAKSLNRVLRYLNWPFAMELLIDWEMKNSGTDACWHTMLRGVQEALQKFTISGEILIESLGLVWQKQPDPHEADLSCSE